MGISWALQFFYDQCTEISEKQQINYVWPCMSAKIPPLMDVPLLLSKSIWVYYCTLRCQGFFNILDSGIVIDRLNCTYLFNICF